MSGPKRDRYERTSLALIAFLYAVDTLLLTVNHDRHASKLTVTSLGVALLIVLVVRSYLRDRRDQ